MKTRGGLAAEIVHLSGYSGRLLIEQRRQTRHKQDSFLSY